jgi:hypothetical protein
MTIIDLTIEKSRRANAIKRAKERNIIIPTYAQMKDQRSCKVKNELRTSARYSSATFSDQRQWTNRVRHPSTALRQVGRVSYLELR